MRRSLVHMAYPKLVYLFSDVICFGFIGSMKQKSALTDAVLDFAKLAATASTALMFKPHLIIFYNFVPQGEVNWDSGKLSKEWHSSLDRDQRKLLHYFYASSQIICFADYGKAASGAPLFFQQHKFLESAIHAGLRTSLNYRKEHDCNFSRERTFSLMSKALNKINKSPKALFNLATLLHQSRPLQVASSESLIAHFNDLLSLQLRWDESVDIMASRIVDLILLALQRSGITLMRRSSPCGTRLASPLLTPALSYLACRCLGSLRVWSLSDRIGKRNWSDQTVCQSPQLPHPPRRRWLPPEPSFAPRCPWHTSLGQNVCSSNGCKQK